MLQFSIFGKTWKVVSQEMIKRGIDSKDQLQCRTHGQKYLLQIDEIKRNIEEEEDKQGGDSNYDKKMYQKLQKYQDDKRYLYKVYLDDLSKPGKANKLEFQTDNAKIMFLDSIPKYIKTEVETQTKEMTLSENENGNQSFLQKLQQIKVAIFHEVEMYNYLKDIKK